MYAHNEMLECNKTEDSDEERNEENEEEEVIGRQKEKDEKKILNEFKNCVLNSYAALPDENLAPCDLAIFIKQVNLINSYHLLENLNDLLHHHFSGLAKKCSNNFNTSFFSLSNKKKKEYFVQERNKEENDRINFLKRKWQENEANDCQIKILAEKEKKKFKEKKNKLQTKVDNERLNTKGSSEEVNECISMRESNIKEKEDTYRSSIDVNFINDIIPSINSSHNLSFLNSPYLSTSNLSVSSPFSTSNDNEKKQKIKEKIENKNKMLMSSFISTSYSPFSSKRDSSPSSNCNDNRSSSSTVLYMSPLPPPPFSSSVNVSSPSSLSLSTSSSDFSSSLRNNSNCIDEEIMQRKRKNEDENKEKINDNEFYKNNIYFIEDKKKNFQKNKIKQIVQNERKEVEEQKEEIKVKKGEDEQEDMYDDDLYFIPPKPVPRNIVTVQHISNKESVHTSFSASCPSSCFSFSNKLCDRQKESDSPDKFLFSFSMCDESKGKLNSAVNERKEERKKNEENEESVRKEEEQRLLNKENKDINKFEINNAFMNDNCSNEILKNKLNVQKDKNFEKFLTGEKNIKNENLVQREDGKKGTITEIKSEEREEDEEDEEEEEEEEEGEMNTENFSMNFPLSSLSSSSATCKKSQLRNEYENENDNNCYNDKTKLQHNLSYRSPQCAIKKNMISSACLPSSPLCSPSLSNVLIVTPNNSNSISTTTNNNNDDCCNSPYHHFKLKSIKRAKTWEENINLSEYLMYRDKNIGGGKESFHALATDRELFENNPPFAPPAPNYKNNNDVCKEWMKNKKELLETVAEQEKWNSFSIFGYAPPSVDTAEIFDLHAFNKAGEEVRMMNNIVRNYRNNLWMKKYNIPPPKPPSSYVHNNSNISYNNYVLIWEKYKKFIGSKISDEEWQQNVSKLLKKEYTYEDEKDLDWKNDPLSIQEVEWYKKYMKFTINKKHIMAKKEVCFCPPPNPKVRWGWNDIRHFQQQKHSNFSSIMYNLSVSRNSLYCTNNSLARTNLSLLRQYESKKITEMPDEDDMEKIHDVIKY